MSESIFLPQAPGDHTVVLVRYVRGVPSKWVLLFVDVLTTFVQFKVCTQFSSQEIAELINEYLVDCIRRSMRPQVILPENHELLCGRYILEISQRHNVAVVYSNVRSHYSDYIARKVGAGVLSTFNAAVLSSGQDSTVEHCLESAATAWNVTSNRYTGYEPILLMLGQLPRTRRHHMYPGEVDRDLRSVETYRSNARDKMIRKSNRL